MRANVVTRSNLQRPLAVGGRRRGFHARPSNGYPREGSCNCLDNVSLKDLRCTAKGLDAIASTSLFRHFTLYLHTRNFKDLRHISELKIYGTT